MMLRIAAWGIASLITLVALFHGRALAAGPSFDCSRASHEIELLICKDPALAAKDLLLSQVFAESEAVLKGLADGATALAELKTIQRGWIKGRDDCWKADDKLACTTLAYDMRIAQLQARYMLVKGGDPVFYMCEDRSEIVATFVPTELPTVRLERGDRTEIAWLQPSGSGSNYEGEFGLSFWIKGDSASVEWPQGTAFTCEVRK